jgi:hypothetical protein
MYLVLGQTVAGFCGKINGMSVFVIGGELFEYMRNS